MKKLLLFSVLGLLACQKPLCEKGPDQTTGLVLRVLDKQYWAYDKKQGEDLSRFGIKISTADQYKRAFAYCCESRLDSIDFVQYDLLGLSTVNKGNNSHYIRDVKRDDAAKKVIYSVSEEYCTRSSPVEGQSNFVLVAKLPSDYRTEYIRNQ